jgi:hypothetical protein
MYRQRTNGAYGWFAKIHNPYIVGAYYFDMWSPRETRVVENTERLYGRSADWWGGIRDFFGKSLYGGKPVEENTRGEGGNWGHLMPRIGYYDVRSTRTLEMQIEQAADAGLQFFAFYWYWNRDTRSEIFGEGIGSYLAATNRSRLKFSIAYFAHPWDHRMHLDEVDAAPMIERLVDLFAHPGYLRIDNQRPYFVLGDSRNIGDGSIKATQDFITALKRATRARMGVEPYVSMQVGLPSWQQITNADGTTCVAAGVQPKGPDTYANMIFRAKRLYRLASTLDRPFSPCVTTHFDERPRKDIMPNSGRYLTDRTDQYFREALLAARAVADQGTHSANRIISVYAWNEWHEGGVLEPNVVTGAKDLNLVTTTFRLPRLPSLCLERGQC